MGIDLPALYRVLVDRFGEDKVTVFPRPPEHVHPARVSREFNTRELAETAANLERANHQAKREAIDEANIIHLYYSDPNGHLRGEAVYVEVRPLVSFPFLASLYCIASFCKPLLFARESESDGKAVY